MKDIENNYGIKEIAETLPDQAGLTQTFDMNAIFGN
jgi:hypothetical protein